MFHYNSKIQSIINAFNSIQQGQICNYNIKSDDGLLLNRINSSIMIETHDHPLYSCFTPNRANSSQCWTCNYCGYNYNFTVPSFYCTSCNYDLCQKCLIQFPLYKSHMYDYSKNEFLHFNITQGNNNLNVHNHRLALIKIENYNLNSKYYIHCRICRGNIANTDQFYYCSLCNFYVCQSCFNNKQQNNCQTPQNSNNMPFNGNQDVNNNMNNPNYNNNNPAFNNNNNNNNFTNNSFNNQFNNDNNNNNYNANNNNNQYNNNNNNNNFNQINNNNNNSFNNNQNNYNNNYNNNNYSNNGNFNNNQNFSGNQANYNNQNNNNNNNQNYPNQNNGNSINPSSNNNHNQNPSINSNINNNNNNSNNNSINNNMQNYPPSNNNQNAVQNSIPNQSVNQSGFSNLDPYLSGRQMDEQNFK